jgi:hypothetical protein
MTQSREPDLRRRSLAALAALSAGVYAIRDATALSLAELSSRDATTGIKAALTRGAEVAVDLLGRTDGFWGNDLVRIALPDWLQRSERVLRMTGYGAQLDELKVGVNRAAEQAVPQAKSLLIGAVRDMSVQDAKGILSGGEDSVTRFFADKTRSPLTTRFLPIVGAVTDRIGLARQYNSLAGQAERFARIPPDQARIERHVTTRALDGLYLIIGEEEKKIRRDPAGSGIDIVRRVFGSLR